MKGPLRGGGKLARVPSSRSAAGHTPAAPTGPLWRGPAETMPRRDEIRKVLILGPRGDDAQAR
jgi:hypothetical protein